MKTKLSLAILLVFASLAQAQQEFSKLVGNVTVQPVAPSATVTVPYITWGGDTATFLANGGLKTENGSIYKTSGLQMQLVPGDDFVGQVKSYLSGKTPFLRGTFHMLGQASEVIAQDPRTKPIVILQLSWSAGDHIVARGEIKSLNGLKAKRSLASKAGRMSDCYSTRYPQPSCRTRM